MGWWVDVTCLYVTPTVPTKSIISYKTHIICKPETRVHPYHIHAAYMESIQRTHRRAVARQVLPRNGHLLERRPGDNGVDLHRQLRGRLGGANGCGGEWGDGVGVVGGLCVYVYAYIYTYMRPCVIVSRTVAGSTGLVGHEHQAAEEDGEEEEAEGGEKADVGEGEEKCLHGAHREALQAAADAVGPVGVLLGG